jgi:hypothetical protein
MLMKNSNNTIGDVTRNLPAYSPVFQPTAPRRAPFVKIVRVIKCEVTTEWSPAVIIRKL